MPLPSTMTPIATQTLTASASSITFSSIPQGYTDLMIVTSAIANVTGADVFVTTYNGDTASNYSYTSLYGSGSSAGSYRGTSVGIILGWMSVFNSSEWSPSTFHFMNYANTTTYKTMLVKSGNATTSGAYVDLSVGLWRSTAAITSINMRTVNGYGIKAGSSFTLYGIKAA
jgi:hypothetical protein